MVRFLLFRIALFLLPFAIWIAWAQISRRRGKPTARTPWAWLIAAGFGLFVLSLVATAVFSPQARDAPYVPSQVGADGRVIQGGP